MRCPRSRSTIRLLPVATLGVILGGAGCTRPPPVDTISLPDGFSIEVFASDVPNARQMALGDEGTVFVGSRTDNRVWALVDNDGDGTADRKHLIAEGLVMPNGVAFRDRALYVAELSRVSRYDDIEARLSDPPDPVVLRDDFPGERQHGWKFLGFGPDGWLYVPVGGPCNVCESEDERFATITRMRPDGSDLEIFARGIRNSVGFDWDPATGELWFTENGRDNLGDLIPADELNHAPEPGMDFGFPYCHGGTERDPEFSNRPCDEFVPPALQLGAHVAPIGMTFYAGSMFPAEYRNQIFIAEHGSWNRSDKVGYRIALVRLENGQPVAYESFAEGWLQGETEWGRPADVLVMPDGALLVSDDLRGAVYRIAYQQG